MRYAAFVGALIAAAVGIHCSAPGGEDSEGTSVAEVVAPPPQKTPAPSTAAEEDREVRPFDSSVPGLAALVHAGIAPRVTSTVKDDSGSQYVTGTFMGTVIIGNVALTSKGEKDVFFLKLGPTGAFQWVRGVGSTDEEHSPKVTLSLEANRVSLVGITDGEMDCGAGPMAPWSSETFFMCLFAGKDGASAGSAVFPTGSP